MKQYLFEIENVSNNLGFLAFIENGKIPFEMRRVYFITDTPNEVRRGRHGHKKLQQILIAQVGSFKVKIINKHGEDTYTLDSPNVGLYVPEMSWRELYDFSNPSCCLVIASELYDNNDYIHDLEVFAKTIDTQEEN
jgi:hypothetical protein